MSYISSSARARYQARLDRYEDLLDKAILYYESLLDTEGAESFKFDSGEASSWAKYTRPEVFQNKVIVPLESWISHYQDKLECKGIVQLGLSMGR
jgi:hypothetical protein